MVGVVTPVAAIVSLGLSLWAVKESHDANQEQSAIKFDAAASVNNLGSTPAGYAVRITLINASLRPIIVNAMELKVGGVPVAPITGVMVGNRSEATGLGDQPLTSARPLPLAVAERGAVTLTGLADFSEAAADARGDRRSAKLDAAEAFCRQLPPEPTGIAAPQVRRGSSDVELEVDYDPGGAETVPVQISSSGAIDNTWRMEVLGPEASPDGIAFWRYNSAPSALRVLTLKVWHGDGGLMRSVSLPVSGAATTEAHFEPLPDGYYRAALLEEGHPLAVGDFDVPLKQGRPLYPLWAQVVNGQCELLEKAKSVYIYSRNRFEGPGGWRAQLRAAGKGS